MSGSARPSPTWIWMTGWEEGGLTTMPPGPDTPLPGSRQGRHFCTAAKSVAVQSG